MIDYLNPNKNWKQLSNNKWEPNYTLWWALREWYIILHPLLSIKSNSDRILWIRRNALPIDNGIPIFYEPVVDTRNSKYQKGKGNFLKSTREFLKNFIPYYLHRFKVMYLK